MSEPAPDWADKIIHLSQTVEAPDTLETPTAFKLVHPNAEDFIKLTWKLGYLAALHDATNVIDEEAVNITMDTLKDWAGSK
jgi:hypothetical protein